MGSEQLKASAEIQMLGHAMYVTELRANDAELRVTVTDLRRP